ncbi:hypothetical protein CCP4SC76_190010 [Gammaproteobacteria bacterium]
MTIKTPSRMTSIDHPQGKPCWTPWAILLFALLLPTIAAAAPYSISTVSGGDLGDGRVALAARIAPYKAAVDPAGNIYIADGNNHRIRKVAAATSIVSTVAGGVVGFSGDGGAAISARLDEPRDVALDDVGNLYVMDFRNCRVRRVNAASGLIETIASEVCGRSLALDAANNVYVGAVAYVYRIDAATRAVHKIAGTGQWGFSGDGGPASAATLSNVEGVAVDAWGNIFIADASNQRIRQINAQSGEIQTIAGHWKDQSGLSGDGGPALEANLVMPQGVSVDGRGHVFIAETGGVRVRRVDLVTGLIDTVAGGGNCDLGLGDGQAATQACLDSPWGVTSDPAGNLLIADLGHGRLRRVDLATGLIATLVGNGNPRFYGDGGPARYAWLQPTGLALDASGGLIVADTGNQRIRRIDLASGVIDTIGGNGAVDPSYSGEAFSGDGRPALEASFTYPTNVAVDDDDNLYVADEGSIREITAATGVVTTVAGGGSWVDRIVDGQLAIGAYLALRGVAVDVAGNILTSGWLFRYAGSSVPISSNHKVWRFDRTSGRLSTLAGTGSEGGAGDGGQAIAAQLAYPYGIALDALGNLFIADRDNHSIRKVDLASGVIKSVAGPADGLRAPVGVAVDRIGNVFVADWDSNKIYRVDAATGLTSVIAGGGSDPLAEGALATGSQLNAPQGIAVDAAGTVYFSEDGRIRKLTPTAPGAQRMVLRDAIYRNRLPLNGDQVLVGADCDVLQLMLDVSSGSTRIAMGQAANLTSALANTAPYENEIRSSGAVFSYTLYRDQPVKVFRFSAQGAATATVFGYCYGTEPSAHVYLHEPSVCINTYSDGHRLGCLFQDNGIGGVPDRPNDVILRDAIYLYGQEFRRDGGYNLVGDRCDALQLVMKIQGDYTDVSSGQAATPDDALAAAVAHPGRIAAGEGLFAYSLYADTRAKIFTFKNTHDPAMTGTTGTVFGYCYSADPDARVYWHDGG